MSEESTGDRVGARLAGKRILLTGASGFLGRAVLAALLRSAGGMKELVVVLRAADEPAARRRLVEEVFSSDAFTGLPADLVRDQMEQGRIRAVPGDLEHDDFGSSAGDAWAGVDTAIHCAATVSFEEALDDALRLNALGPSRLLKRLHDSGSEPHFVHVSTAYVADRRSGTVSEDGIPHHGVSELDPDALLAEGEAWREAMERESTTALQRQRFEKAARRDASRRKGMDPTERAEELRRRWVRDRLSRKGRRHAISIGWPDTYALSKALGERMVAERSDRITVIRPTIIESALEHPSPGWLEGIKVADPLILAYASRGLTHLPGRAENVIDIVPVDHVANVCVAAAAYPPERSPRTLAIGSSCRNPLAIGRLAEEIREFFLREPLLGRNGTPIQIGSLKFVDRSAALRATIARERVAAIAARLAVASPVRLPQERLLRSNRALAERVTRMVKIYGAYTELDCVFEDANTQALFRSLPAEDRADLPFDTAAIDWGVYLQEIHLPQVRRLAGDA